MKEYLKLLRVKHYVKNILIFLPIFFGSEILKLSPLIDALLAFILFCLVSSIVYIFNDIQDRHADRAHETKRKRPLASGKISVANATLAMALCIIAVLCLSFAVPHFYPTGLAVILSYIAINFAYSRGLKKIPVLDTAILSYGFIARVIFGAVAINIALSGWMYLTIAAVSMYMSLGKRAKELQNNGHDSRPVLKKYTLEYLHGQMNAFLVLSIAFYSLWALGSPNNKMLFSVIPFVLIVQRYSLIISKERWGDPTEIFLGDKILVVLAAVYTLTTFTLTYFF